MGKKTFKRAVSLVIALMMILSGTQVFFADTLPAYDEGDIKLSKTATPVEGKENTYKIQLSVQGKDIDTSKDVDVVLVIDNSNSMHDTEDDGKSLAQITKDAANAFIDGVLTESNNGNVRVAVVQYGSYARAYQFTSNDWTDGWSNSLTVDGSEVYVADNASAKDAVNKATTKFSNSDNGGTNTEGGFLMASKVVGAKRSDAESIVIFMTDGMPTFRYDSDGDSVRDGSFWLNGGIYTSKRELNEAIEAAQELKDSSKLYTVALLSAFSKTSDEAMLASYLLSKLPKKYNSDNDIRNIMPHVNKDRWKETSSYAEKYYPIFSEDNASDKMQEIYSNLAGTINALAQGYVTDIIPKDFELTEDSKKDLEEREGIEVIENPDQTTTLIFPNISASEAGTNLPKFTVKVKPGVYGTGYTNKEAVYTFTMFGASETDTKKFPKPVVPINPTAANDDGYSVYQGNILTVTEADNILKNDETVKLQEGEYTVSNLVVKNNYVGTMTTSKGGSVIVSSDGTFVYNPPNDDFTGTDTFKYKNITTVSGSGSFSGDYESNEATVSIMVMPMDAEMAVYKTEYYLQNADLVSYTLKETITDTGIIDETVYGEWKYYQGYYYNPEVAGTVSTVLSMKITPLH